MKKKPSKPTYRSVKHALKVLTERIGVYGDRIDHPLSLHWGNGLVLRDSKGWMITAGTEHIARYIMEIKKAGRLI